ncbi:ABC transporter ATP-binding protein [Halomarina pelagica]|uniref:ABC transporter ATP-binding protein n=1 Tax=Halomarina pelagica TaxID=2961599 RepID=UPI0020C39CEC|nr:ABC transporter ATP-binding protein [Halomarina sp. BND7]
MHAIDVSEVTKTYGEVTALDGLSLTVDRGATFGLLGTNGAGKSTLFKLLVGHTTPDAGSLAIGGTDVTTAGASIRRDVGYLPEHAGFPPTLTGREVLAFTARMRDLAAADDRIASVLSVVGLEDAADRRVGGYSNGMTRRLGLATALLSRPRTLLLDEPTAGLDPRGVSAFHRTVRYLADREDLTVVLSSHVLSEVESLCESVAVLHDGRLLTEGSVAALKRRGDAGVEVRVRLRSPDDVDEALAVISAHDVDGTSTTGTALEIECDPSTAIDLVSALDDAVGLDGYEVREPGLGRAFERALATATGARE